MAQPHRAWLPDELRADQRAENLLGCLHLAGEITEAECWAGERYRRIMGDFRRLLASPGLPPSAVSRMVAPGVETPAEADHLGAERPETDEERSRRILAAYDGVRDEVLHFDRAFAGRIAEDFDALICRDKACRPEQWPVIKRMLARLVDVWGLDADAPRTMRSTMTRDQRSGWPHDEREVIIIYDGGPCKAEPDAA